MDRVRGSVHLHVHADIEQMLVMYRADSRRYDHRIAVFPPRSETLSLHDAGQLYLELERAVEIEVPVVAVLIIQIGADVGQDQAALTTHLRMVIDEVPVLPEDRVILLMQADDPRNEDGLALVVVDSHVEVLDHTKTVAAKFERVRCASDAE